MKEKKAAIVEWKIPTVPDKEALTKRTTPLLDQSKTYVIKSEDHFLASWSLVQRHDEAIKKIEELFDPFVSGLHKLHLMAIAMRNEFLKPITDSKARLLGIRKVWRAEQEVIKREQDAKAAKLLQQQQQKELERQAKTAERKGDTEVAEVLREQKAAVPLPFFNTAPAVPKQEGSVIKKRWIFEIVDPAAVEREYCSPDPKLIRPVVEALGPACKISGLRIEQEEKEHSRSVANGL
jgi:hypothetical protein